MSPPRRHHPPPESDPPDALARAASARATIWARPERASRGPKPAHTRDQITAVALALADAEGIDAVSIRRIATELGSGATSLYRYFATKDELFELMADAVIGEGELVPLTGEWRADLRALAFAERDRIKRHPWVLSLHGGRSVLGPNSLRWLDHSLSIVEDLGLDIDEMMVLIATVQALVHGYVMDELSAQEATRRSGLDEDAWMASVRAYGGEIIEKNEFPRVVRVMVEAEGPHAKNRSDRDFTLGLDRVLDGFAASLG